MRVPPSSGLRTFRPVVPLSDAAPPPIPRAVWLALLALLVGRLVVAGTSGLVVDEAYYWVWGQHLAAGYFDHPPAVAWMIAASSALLGDDALGVRAGAVVLGVAGIALLTRWARDRWLFLLLAAGVPLAALGGLVATPDAPLAFGWALALHGALLGGTGGWLVAGLGAGIAGLGKYTGWGLWPLFVLAAPREWRRMVPGIAVTALVLAPNLAWNATHGWVSVLFQLHHGLGSSATPAPAPGLLGGLGFLAAQAGLVTPFFFAAAVAWWARLPADREDRLLWLTSLGPVAFFTLAATLARGEVNWAAPAWLGACLGVARAAGRPRVVRLAALGGWLGLLLTVGLVVDLHAQVLPIPAAARDRVGEGEELAQVVRAWGIEPVYTTRYEEAAELTLYGGLEAYALPGVDRPDQYDLWPIRWASPALFVRPCKSGARLSSDPFCPERGVPGQYDGGPHEVRDGSGCWQVFVVAGCRDRF